MPFCGSVLRTRSGPFPLIGMCYQSFLSLFIGQKRQKQALRLEGKAVALVHGCSRIVQRHFSHFGAESAAQKCVKTNADV